MMSNLENHLTIGQLRLKPKSLGKYRFKESDFMRLTAPFTVLLFCLSLLPAQAKGPMPAGAQEAIDTAVGICLELIAGKTPRTGRNFTKSGAEFVRGFDEGAAGILDSKFQLNGSGQPRVVVASRNRKNKQGCLIATLRIGGGYAKHLAQVKAGFARRGWEVKRGSGRNLLKGKRRMSLSGRKHSDRLAEVLMIFIVTEYELTNN
jgi:hypothetical protein